MANPAVSGTFEYWITDRIGMTVIRPITGHIGAFEGWTTERIYYSEYQAQFSYNSGTGGITPSGVLLNQAGKVLVGAIIPSGVLTIVKNVAKIIAGVLTFAGDLITLFIAGPGVHPGPTQGARRHEFDFYRLLPL